MARKKAKPVAEKPAEPRELSPELQANMERFVRSLGHVFLMKVDPAAARELAALKSQ